MSVESVVRGQNANLIAHVAELWIKPHHLVLDTTYGNGLWWRRYRPQNLIAHDLDPAKGDGVDFRSLPEETASIDVAAFDPPYTAKGGRETSGIPEFDAAYGLKGAPKSPDGVDQLIADGLTECARVLKPGGICLLKVANYISSGKYHNGHMIAVNNALADDLFKVADEFIHYSGTGPQPQTNLDGSPRRQVHSRSAHSFLTVLQRTKMGWL